MDRSGETALERLEFLIASPNRYRLLYSLSDGATSPDTLGEELDLPRSTLRRNLTALEDQGYISHAATENRYEITVTGKIACEAIGDALSTIEFGASIGPFFERFPVALPIGLDELASCDVTVSTTDTPFEPLYHVRRNIMDASAVRGFVPTINPLYLDTLQECIGEDQTLEVVAPPAGYDSASPDYDETLTAISASENISLYESDSVPEYALGIVDNTVLLGTFDDRMRTHSVLAAPAQSTLQEWATEQFSEIKSTATPY